MIKSRINLIEGQQHIITRYSPDFFIFGKLSYHICREYSEDDETKYFVARKYKWSRYGNCRFINSETKYRVRMKGVKAMYISKIDKSLIIEWEFRPFMLVYNTKMKK